MDLLELMTEYYPQESEIVKEKLPEMYKFAKEVQVIQWQKEFEVADKNPEVFKNIKVLEMLYDSKMISEEEYIQQRDEILRSGYASITMGVAFIEDKQVSFREKIPGINVILHELGHIYFRVSDLVWNAMYGGGEVLMHLALANKIGIPEKQIREYMSIYSIIRSAPLEKIEEIERIIGENIQKQIDIDLNRILPMTIMAGTLPTIRLEKGEELLYTEWDPVKIQQLLEDKEIIIEPESLKGLLLMFISAYLQDGIRYNDPFYRTYAIGFYRTNEKTIEDIIKLFNPNMTIEEYKQLEDKTSIEEAAYILTNQ
ncbi:MAG: hypothetical protein ACK4SW_04590 [Sulfurihydrogenibium azorense]